MLLLLLLLALFGLAFVVGLLVGTSSSDDGNEEVLAALGKLPVNEDDADGT